MQPEVISDAIATGHGNPCPYDVEELTDDALTGDFRILQRRRGHRYSIDDVLTAYQAARITPSPARYLDLGCGIGSVLLMVAHKHRATQIEAVEAQAQSFSLATENVRRAQQQARVTLHHGDLRDTSLLDRLHGPFDLITGTPPYQPPGAGTPSPDSQRAHARVELRGGVEAYLEAGARVLSTNGRLVVCGDARFPGRVFDTAQRLGLRVIAQLDAVPYANRKAPLFSVWTLGWALHVPAQAITHHTFYARTEDGGRTEAAHQLRRFFDLPVNEHEAPSPPARDQSGPGRVPRDNKRSTGSQP